MNIYKLGEETSEGGKGLKKRRSNSVRCPKCNCQSFGLLIISGEGDTNDFIAAKSVFCEVCQEIKLVGDLKPLE